MKKHADVSTIVGPGDVIEVRGAEHRYRPLTAQRWALRYGGGPDAELVATETAGFVCDRAVQHLGGLGVKRGSVVERLYREVKVMVIGEVASILTI